MKLRATVVPPLLLALAVGPRLVVQPDFAAAAAKGSLAYAPLSAADVCWIDRERETTADQLPVTSPQVAGMRGAAREINRILKASATLQSLPEVRTRSTWTINGHPRRGGGPYGAHLILWAHGPEVWGPGACELLPHADRITPRAAVVVQTNSINSTLTQRHSSVRDELIEAFIEPEVVGRIGRYPVYQGQWIVLTFDGRVPWVPLTMEEYLDFEERRLTAAEAETTRGIAEAQAGAGQFDEAALRESYEAMRAVNPEEAERFRLMMEEVRQQVAAAAAAAPRVTNAYTQAVADLRELRASLTPLQLRQQAREGYASIAPHAPVARLPKLVKMDPDFPWDPTNPNRIRLMEIHYSGQGTPYEELMADAAAGLDWAALEALMR